MADSHGHAGRRILVVEDEAMIAMLMEDMLRDLGCFVVGPAHGLTEALDLVRGPAEVDAAVLDVNLGGVPCFALADELRGMGVPLIFSTGYGDGGLREVDRGAPVLQKPFRSDDLARALAEAFAERSTSLPSAPRP
jgi:CheY-like chemotaxis protein